MTKDVNVFLRDFPNTKESEVITENSDGSYTVFLNARLSHDRLIEAYRHALAHIDNEDFRKEDVQLIELEAHSGIPVDSDPAAAEDHTVMSDEEISMRIARLRRQRRRIKKQLEEYERNREYLASCGVDFSAIAEDQRLYGGI